MQLHWKIAKLLSIAHTLGYDNYVEVDGNLCTISIETNKYPETNYGYQRVKFDINGIQYGGGVSKFDTPDKLLNQLRDTLEEFLDRDTWTVKFRVYKQPMENTPNFGFPVFDTWLEATHCVNCLRELPKNYLQTTDGDWVEVENVD